jgi:hypothetical protein
MRVRPYVTTDNQADGVVVVLIAIDALKRSVEYQEYAFGSFGGPTIPKDRRFNLAFTLAGIGTFSNFFGNFGGASY